MPKSRNPQLAQSVNKYGRSAAYSRSGRWAVKNKVAVSKSVAGEDATKEVKFGKGTRVVPTQVLNCSHFEDSLSFLESYPLLPHRGCPQEALRPQEQPDP